MKKTLNSLLVFAFLAFCSETALTYAATPAPDIVLITAGEFLMGAPLAANESFDDEQPVHRVHIDGFYMDKTETPKAFWDDVYQWGLLHGYNFDHTGSGRADDHPVYGVTWYDVVKWCNARSEKEGKLPAYYLDDLKTIVYRRGQSDIESSWVDWNSGYRLPTEAEWEKAARGGLIDQRFPWGQTISHENANYGADPQSYDYDISPTSGYHPDFMKDISEWGKVSWTSPVDYFNANGYGLFNMAGNVREWCWDWYDPSYYHWSSYSNPNGPNVGTDRVLRGGGWRYRARWCRTSVRSLLAERPDYVGTTAGFRTVLPSSLSGWFNSLLLPVRESYDCPFQKKDGADSLIVITHGLIKKEDGQTEPPDPKWIDEMAEAMRNNLSERGLSNWQVEAYRWKEEAWLPTFSAVVKDDVLDNAEKDGLFLGSCVAQQDRKNIILVAHSAGAALIQAMTKKIKSLNSKVTLFCIFLDPFIGSHYGGRKKYGQDADWAINFFARDPVTYDHLFGRTVGRLENAYNVDVTRLVSSTEEVPVLHSTSSGLSLEKCFQHVSSHGWPHEFFYSTIPPNSVEGADEFGFSLVMDNVDNIDWLKSQYPPGREKVLGSEQEELCVPYEEGNIVDYPLNIRSLMKIESPKGSKLIGDNWVTLSTAGSPEQQLRQFALPQPEPAWFAVEVILTNTANFISFESAFTSEGGAEGLLTVYWGTNEIASIDERFALPEMTAHTLEIPEGKNGVLGFRLDTYTNTSSSVTITNLSLGFAGTREPYILSIEEEDVSTVVITLTGPEGNYVLDNSSNLIDWELQAIFVNTNGIMRYMDRNTNGYMFYRAMGQ